MHRWLLDNANPHGNGIKTGKMLVGISTLVFVIALLTGYSNMVAESQEKFEAQPYSSLQKWLEGIVERGCMWQEEACMH